MNFCMLTVSGRNYLTRLVPETPELILKLIGLFLFRPTIMNKMGNFKRILGCLQGVTFVECLYHIHRKKQNNFSMFFIAY